MPIHSARGAPRGGKHAECAETSPRKRGTIDVDGDVSLQSWRRQLVGDFAQERPASGASAPDPPTSTDPILAGPSATLLLQRRNRTTRTVVRIDGRTNRRMPNLSPPSQPQQEPQHVQRALETPGTSPARAPRRIETCAHALAVSEHTAIETVPTGFSGCTAAGTGDSGDADTHAVPARARTPSAIARATGSLTAPCSCNHLLGHAKTARLSTRCCSRPRRDRRSRSCRARRSAATTGDRRCTTRPARCEDARSRRRSPTTASRAPAVDAVNRRAKNHSQFVDRGVERGVGRHRGCCTRAVKCSSICPSTARIVVEIGTGRSSTERRSAARAYRPRIPCGP